MTGASGSVATPWYGRPRLLTLLLVGAVLIATLVAPERATRPSVERRLTTRSTDPGGASLLLELGRALGWRVSDNVTATFPAGPRIVHAVLDPSEPLRAPEVRQLLERVRAGAGLLVVIRGGRDALGDSLRLTAGPSTVRPTGLATHCEGRDSAGILVGMTAPTRFESVAGPGTRAPRVDTLLAAPEDDTPDSANVRTGAPAAQRPLAVGFPLGRGRVVAVADGTALRNDILRYCTTGFSVPYVRWLEYLRDSSAVVPRDLLVFDEYHQGHGVQPGTIRAVVTFFAETATGHAVAQLAFAALLLLAAKGGRLVPPPPDVTDERRSPLEHVDALARAYAQVGATRTATQRLVRGVRRRTAPATARAGSLADDEWLASVAARAPARTGDVARVRTALGAGVPPGQFPAVADALAAIEASLTDLRPDPR